MKDHKHGLRAIGRGVPMPPNLPPANTKRWIARHKAEVIAAVRGGTLTTLEACHRYGISADEFMEWERHYEAEGLNGLRASVRLPPHPLG